MQGKSERIGNALNKESLKLLSLTFHTAISNQLQMFSAWFTVYFIVNELIGESLFTFFASLAYVPFFLLELQTRFFWILKELHKISFVWKYGADMLNSFLVMRV